MKSNLYKFRRYKKTEGGKNKKAKHPKLIVDENSTDYGFMGLTEAKKRGHHKNIELSKNPQKGKKNKSFIRRELRYDKKEQFGKILTDYELAKEDIPKIRKEVEKHKKKKQPIGGSH